MKNKKSYDRFMTCLLTGSLLIGAVSCGNSDNGNNGDDRDRQEEQAPLKGKYHISFAPVNPALNSTLTGEGDIEVSDTKFKAHVRMSGLSSGMHMQHIHTGSICPDLTDDDNSDGYVDAVEAAGRTGKILIPFDSNLNAQMLGRNSYPAGNFNYNRTGIVQLMLADLMLPDTDTTDSMVKLPAGEDLLIEGRVIEIHGVPSSTSLPATVRTIDGMTNYKSIPIACGVITRVEDEEEPTTDGGTATGGSTVGGTATGGTTGI